MDLFTTLLKLTFLLSGSVVLHVDFANLYFFYINLFAFNLLFYSDDVPKMGLKHLFLVHILDLS